MGKKILVVDNDRLILQFMKDLLLEKGHEVVTAEDGISALEILKEFIPDVAFVDLVMPNIRGNKLCRIMRSMPSLKDLYLVIISATTMEELTHFEELGANAAIAKGPFPQFRGQLLDILSQINAGASNKPEERLGNTGHDYEKVYERKVTKELLYAERHLEVILNNICEGIFELTPEGKIIFCNNKGFTLCGLSEASLLGKRFPELFRDDDRKNIEALLLQMGDGPPEISDKSHVSLGEKQMSLKLLPLEDILGWTIIAILTPNSMA